jgi:hypothetical protein
MEVRGDYASDGHALIERLVAPKLAKVLLDRLWADLGSQKINLSFAERPPFLEKSAMELHGARHQPMTRFHWGLTAVASMLTGRELLPSYCFVRVYQQGDVLKVHSDREECEHSMSLTLGSSEGIVWPLEIGRGDSADWPVLADDFGTEPVSTFAIQPGDALLYRGVQHRHARLTPNPNKWSAHLFLHWVDSAGSFSNLAFENIKLEDA